MKGMTMAGLAAALLAGCELNVGNSAKEEGQAAAPGNGAQASAEGAAEDGKISFKAPGVDFALNVPGGLDKHSSVDSDNPILYPGSTIGGIHIAAGGEGGEGVEMRFGSADAPDKISAWYRDPARAKSFTLDNVRQEDDGVTINGTTADKGETFTLRLTPRGGGGTQGRLTIRDAA